MDQDDIDTLEWMQRGLRNAARFAEIEVEFFVELDRRMLRSSAAQAETEN